MSPINFQVKVGQAWVGYNVGASSEDARCLVHWKDDRLSPKRTLKSYKFYISLATLQYIIVRTLKNDRGDLAEFFTERSEVEKPKC